MRVSFTTIFLFFIYLWVGISAGDEGGEITEVSLDGDWLVISTSELYPPRIKVSTEESPPTIYIDMLGTTISDEVTELASGGLVAELNLWQYKYNPLVARLAVVCSGQVRYRIYRKKYDGSPSQIRVQIEALDSPADRGDYSQSQFPLMGDPSADSAPLAYLERGTKIQVLDSSDDWLAVRTGDGAEGWILASYVTVKDDRAVAGTIRARIVESAKSYLGVPYVYGGQSREGMDCSGLVQKVYSEVGISILRGCHDQYDDSNHISRDLLRPGDLVFFSTTSSGPSHVGIYIGGDSFIHAESSDAGVTITKFDAPYWKDRIYGFGTYLQ